MFQSSLFDGSFTNTASDDVCFANHFDGHSEVVNGYYDTDMSTKKVVKPSRRTSVGDQIDCYRNLGRPSYFSIKQKKGSMKGLVSGYAKAIVIKNPEFRVSEASRQRVTREGQRNVHAYVSGEVIDIFNGNLIMSLLGDHKRVSYNPFQYAYFFTVERDQSGNMIEATIEELKDAGNYEYAIINGGDVILTNF